MSVGNNLPVDLYSRLIPRIIQEDVAHGLDTYVGFWDDPLLKWDDTLFWDQTGLLPILKNVFFAIEKEEEKDLLEISKLTDLVDPEKCPEEFIPHLANTLGITLHEDFSIAKKREIISGAVQFHKLRGTPISWDVFYRTMGIKVDPVPLWKKQIHEADGNYSRFRFETEKITAENIGSGGSSFYSGALMSVPIVPGSVRIRSGNIVLRDSTEESTPNYGELIGQNAFGKINYITGTYELEYAFPTTSEVTVDYQHITSEYPYRAARIDLDVYFMLRGDGSSTDTLLTADTLQKIVANAEEVRPIHVLLRLVVLVLFAEEVLSDFASDVTRCGPELVADIRSDEYRMYGADCHKNIQNEYLLIDKSDERTIVADDYTTNTYMDALIVEFSNGQPKQYW